jgi:small subunit ribosomal protein S5
MVQVPLSGSTIPHDIISRFGASEVMMRPARPGTGVIAGGAVRAVVELAGVKDIVTKARRSTNPINTVKAAFQGLQMLKDLKAEMEKRQHLVEAPPQPRRRDRQRRRPPRLEPRPRTQES